MGKSESMKILSTVLLLTCLASASAQVDFGYPADRDTVLPLFETALENEAYEYLRSSPKLPEGWKIVSISPLSIKMWSEHAGWDIVVLDPSVGKAGGFLYDFSWNATELAPSAVEARLLQIVTAKEKGPR